MQRMPRRRVVVVNDDTVFLSLMNDLLSEEGYRTVVLRENEQPYDVIKRERPELLIIDMRIGNPDAAWMILETVRLDPATTNIPVILCSADIRLMRSKARLLREQRCEVLEKPFNLDKLLATVEKMFEAAS